MPHDVFISYCSSDRPVADAMCAALESDGVRCWIAPRDVRPGQEYAQEIVNAVSSCQIVILVFSAGANGSPQVRREIERAVAKAKIIIPFRIKDAAPTASMEHWLASIQWLDAMTPPLQEHLNQLGHIVHAYLTGADAKQPLPSSKGPGLAADQHRNVCRELTHQFRLTRQRLLGPDPRATPIPPAKIAGLNFSPYVDGQDPNRGSRVTEDQLIQRMGVIAPRTQWIRTFGTTNGLERAGAVAHSLGLKAAIGAWLWRDLTANELEISNLIASARANEADLLIVGSEVLLRNDLSEAALLDYLVRVKQAVPGIQVAYADVYSELLAHPNVLEAVDVVLANFYPYWEGVHVESAVAAIHRQHSNVVAASNGKEVIVSETGWPSAGDAQGNALPSPENAARFFQNFVSWAEAEGVHYFYFEAFDEAWKAAYEGPQGAHWGVWDKDGTFKAGMANVFEGERMADN